MEGGSHAQLLAALDTRPALPPGPDVVAPFEPVFYEATSHATSVAERQARDVNEPEPVPPAAPPWRERTVRLRAPWFVAVVVSALVVGLVAGRAVTHRGSGTQSADRVAAGNSPAVAPSSIPAAGGGAAAPADPSGASAPASAASAATPGAPGSPKLLLDIRRQQGPMTTTHFTVPGGRWVLGWAYDCSAVGGQGDFQVTVYKPDGLPGTEGGVNQRGVKGSSVAAYTTTGERYLGVQTNCVWAIRVTA